jgi:putative transcriptional regulator
MLRWFFGIALAASLALVAPQRQPRAEEAPHFVGQFLVAAPTMADPRFQESVVYMIGHGEDGALGLVINRPIAQGPLADLLKAVGRGEGPAEGNVTINYGGPVDSAELFILHGNDYATKATRFVGNGLGVTSDREILRAIADGKGPRQKLFIFGYTGWAPGQLESEIESGAWYVIPADLSLVFSNETEKTWERAIAKRKQKI